MSDPKTLPLGADKVDALLEAVSLSLDVPQRALESAVQDLKKARLECRLLEARARQLGVLIYAEDAENDA